MVLKWLTIVGLSMTPALVAGQSAAVMAAISFGYHPQTFIPVVSTASFLGGLIVAGLADLSARIPLLKRLLERAHKPGAVSWCRKWGPWGGLLVGAAIVGPMPIIVVLRWMLVSVKRILIPLLISSILYTIIYWLVLLVGLAGLKEMEGLDL